MTGPLDIRDVADASGLRPSALRYYEQVGLIRSVARRGGRRQYESSVLRRLEIIALCREAGFTISDVAEVFNDRQDAVARWRQLAAKKIDEIAVNIERARARQGLLEQALACGCSDPLGCDFPSQKAGRAMGTP